MQMLATQLAALAAEHGCTLELSRRCGSRADAALVAGGAGADLSSATTGAWRLGATVARQRGERVLIRFPDAGLEEDARRFCEVGGWSAPGHLAGEQYRVAFLDPNLVKPLHVGHLRNVVLGWSITSLLRTCGAQVVTQCVACDYGRAVAEAMAGVIEAGGWTAAPALEREPADEFVGNCYRRYVAALNGSGARQPTSTTNEPVERELRSLCDPAEEVIALLRSGDATADDLRKRVVDWARTGQLEVLARIGVSIDEWLLESDQLKLADALVDEGLRAGTFRRDGSGAVFYSTGWPEYPELWLTRPDGAPTEHLRALAVWHDLWRQLDRVVVVHVFGEEWHHATEARVAALRAIDVAIDDRSYRRIGHAHVLTDVGSKMGSSAAGAVTVRTLLDTGTGTELLATWLGLLSLEPGVRTELLRTTARALTVARWLESVLAAEGPSDAPDPADPVQRYSVLQAYRLWNVLGKAAAEPGPRHVVRWMMSVERTLGVPGPVPGTLRKAAALAVRALGLPASAS